MDKPESNRKGKEEFGFWAVSKISCLRRTLSKLLTAFDIADISISSALIAQCEMKMLCFRHIFSICSIFA